MLGSYLRSSASLRMGFFSPLGNETVTILDVKVYNKSESIGC